MAHNPVSHPSHYREPAPLGINILIELGLTKDMLAGECIDAIEWLETGSRWSWSLLTAVKYIWRAGNKGDAVQDISKAIWLMERWVTQKKSWGFVWMLAQHRLFQCNQQYWELVDVHRVTRAINSLKHLREGLVETA